MDEPASCQRCGSTRSGTPADADLDALAWASERDGTGRVHWLCPRCAREHIRDIEAKLPADWW